MNWEQKEIFENKVNEMELSQLLSPAYAMLLRVYLKAGLRPGEGRALKAGDIDFQRRRLRIERAATLNGQVKNTKTGEMRWVDLSDGLLKDLDTYRTLRTAEDVGQGKDSEWLFPSLTGTLLDESHMIRAFHRVLEASGLPRFQRAPFVRQPAIRAYKTDDYLEILCSLDSKRTSTPRKRVGYCG